MKKSIQRIFYFLSVTGMLFTFVSSTAAQNDDLNIALSNAPSTDFAKLNEIKFKADDPLYFILVINKRIPHTLRDLVSTHPKTGEKNIFICVDMPSPDMQERCTGILPTPLSDELLNGKSTIFTILPPAASIDLDKDKLAVAILKGFGGVAGYSTNELSVALWNFDTNKSEILRAPISFVGYSTSRWNVLNGMIVDRRLNAKKAKQLAFSETEPLPRSLLPDPVAEKDLYQLAVSQFAATHRVYKVAFINSDWGYLRNEYGVLYGRAARVAFMMKRNETGDCEVHYTMYAFQDHISGGQFSKTRLKWRDDQSEWKYVKCEKFIGFK